MKLVKTIYFDAAHKLNDYLGKCSNIHGHTWKVEISIKIPKMDVEKTSLFNGILLDFTIMKSVENIFDHKYLNDVITINPTAENLSSIICLMVAEFMNKRLISLGLDYPRLQCDVYVKLWESKSSYVKVNNKEAQCWLGLDARYTYKRFMKK
ncbi:hypothetical protein LCGC14_0560300 [marine sediment metagenome]|uniref:6-pyruvoyl tetrahydrobiopterin synthase n=1 Tax=marine sediment metagenome TaxID=412755 RepID=A0A0F9S5Z1_9ZZZZ